MADVIPSNRTANFEQSAALLESGEPNSPMHVCATEHQLLANTRYWLENKTFAMDEALLRFHHQLTRIHPFANGNGRHARMIAGVVAVKLGQPEFAWGAGKDLVAEGDARTRYLTALRALDAMKTM